ncbi:MBOAT family O-acyltransferase [Mucilaginibacter sp.]|uniref:MBOAT family O-acyltransferase n=1 Tax=Mucilaginibacter sp. TaxID=1882438 RepID=UPI0025F62FA0|nr:MBOAT family O-acyltransferase [Mucilaginibacter sp.]
MLFASILFACFFIVFFLLYWYVFSGSLKFQNLLILTGSYLFYAWWDWRFLLLLIGSSIISYFLGIGIGKTGNKQRRSLLLWIGLLQGLGCLVFFKYFNFLVGSMAGAFAWFNVKVEVQTLNIILPLGISFYTFRIISYLLDIKNGKIQPTTSLVTFCSYVAFFPSLIAGPIDRPKTLIPQLEKERTFDYNQAADGLRQILWGLFKKIVIADNCAAFTNDVLSHYQTLPASALLFSMALFAIQVYADFSGYSDIAIGLASLLGFKITRNFNYPFFAQNIAGFWRRWHISLTSWLTDYVFTPLSVYFRAYSKFGLILAILINFTLIGIWHGASWTFVFFGFLNGCLYIPLILNGTLSKKKKNTQDVLKTFLNIAGMFVLLMFTFLIFRAETLAQAFDYYRRLFSPSLFKGFVITEKVNMAAALLAIIIMFIAEWKQRDKEHALQMDGVEKTGAKMLIYYGLVLFILVFSATNITDFVYFKF